MLSYGRIIIQVMAMSARNKSAGGQVPGNDELPSILASLGLTEKPRFSDWQDERKHRIHWAIRVLKHAGYGPASIYDFDHYICGPFSQSLEDDLLVLQWGKVTTVEKVDDDSICIAREAILRGDDFLLALSLAVGMADRNPGASKDDVIWAIPVLIPDLKAVAEDACDFAEARIWPR